MIPPFHKTTQSSDHEGLNSLTVLPTGVFKTLSPVFTHGLALVGIVGGFALGVWLVWLLVIRTCKLKANIASDGTSESAPLLNPDQTGTNLQRGGLIDEGEQRDHTSTLLCSICAKIDFYKIFLDGIPEDEEIPLDLLSSILEKSYQCSFCRLISFHVRRTFDVGQLSSRRSLSDRMSAVLDELRLSSGALLSPTQISLLPPPHQYGGPTGSLGELSSFKGNSRVKNTVDIDLVKNWIKLCQENHGDECQSAWRKDGEDDRKLPAFVRVVDVVSMAMIPAPSGCRYVALSYVWGGAGTEYWTTKDNIAERSKPGGLNTTKLPETITDSILFVRQLGERYIWIDALCIIQDDLQDKLTQIHAMDLVYGLSYLTIIAAGGTTARDPLPGCRPRTRTLRQHIEVVQGLHLYVSPPRLGEALALSTWNTRCWTYQESALSRRRIYFTGQQVHFECRGDVFAEDIVAESKGHQFSTSFLRLSRREFFPSADSFGSYMEAVKQCTQRNLTVESDIVNALTGVTNALAIGFGLGKPARVFHYGMMLTDLHHALLWQHDPHTPRARRSLFDGDSSPWPSWAWATWRGAVDYMTEHRYVGIDTSSGEPSVAETLVGPWHIVDQSGDTMQLDVRRVSRIVSIPMTEEEKSGYSSPRGILDPTELTLSIHRPLEPGTLIFRTTSSHFGITRRGGEENEETSACLHHGLFNILSTTSSPPTWVGTVVLPLDPAPPTTLEFIVLSRTGTRGVYDEERLVNYQECLLHVMAVSQNEGLMERVGLGVIHEAAWIASRPEERVVFLR
ncbi:heterokaryon incompatibility protein-domain-containing protein [Suillus paluster]|uniref:heterokaryon incompatibility protein-domain-containing protein n=1 Tax=Suillus paluster TaxID=48578 RepID=UPI001B871417|nr:heterokaryon incompatibility protein-domain-containing protein [Suillus paluster]KAG1756326.1 heterokaryon incompatibility protein-domain-containing protein [Suillus paluster]